MITFNLLAIGCSTPCAEQDNQITLERCSWNSELLAPALEQDSWQRASLCPEIGLHLVSLNIAVPSIVILKKIILI